jgi:hypothetical protein
MTEHLVELEPTQTPRRMSGRSRPDTQLRKAELEDIAASETLVLATAIAQSVLGGLDMKERRKFRRLLILIVGGLACVLIGIAKLAVQLHS